MGEAFITGLGIVSPIGIGREAFAAGLRAGRAGARRLQGLDASTFRIGRGAEIDDADFDGEGDVDGARCLALALRACHEAVADADLDGGLPEDATIAVGSGAGEMRATEQTLGLPQDALALDHPDPLQAPNSTTSKLAAHLGLSGRQLTFVNACAAGAQAIAVAADLVRHGRAQMALAGGVEVLNAMVMSGFEALRAVSPTTCRPFDPDRDGILLGELAAFVVLESGEHARRRGVRPYARVLGSGASADAFHVVRPDEHGAGAVLALRRALDDAGLAPIDIDYVNTHGTGTPQNDPAELAALTSVFGERLRDMPISSTKSMLGHALGASGAAEVVICALALREGFLPPTMGLRRPIAGYEGLDFVANAAREGIRLQHVVSNAFAFGGTNVVIALSAPDAPTA